MTEIVKNKLDVHISSKVDLINFLHNGARPEEQWGIGIEVENQLVDSNSCEVVSYTRIEELLKNLIKTERWQGIRENGNLIALKGNHSSLTLEPGGQVELSGDVFYDVHSCFGDLSKHISDVVKEADKLDLTILGLGVQPFTKPEEIEWLPKERYDIMGPYMSQSGDMGHRMMKQSAGIQVNLDYSDEADCIEKLRIVMLISPLLYALFANSPFMDGNTTGFLSTRGEIWTRTDRDRTGLIHALFSADATVETYVDYALQVPMYFIVRDGILIDLTKERFTFNQYLKEGFGSYRATVADWDLHLSTLFTEARLRPQIEIRSIDSLPPRFIPSVAALLKGLFYDTAAREEILELLKYDDEISLERLYRTSWQSGLKTPVENRTLREVALDTIAISRRSLKRQMKKNEQGLDESIYLDEIEEIAESGVTLAERLLDGWSGTQEDKIDMIVEHCGYR